MRSFRCVFRPYSMKRILTILLLATLMTRLAAQPQTYEWTTPSKNASESMPCGGGDVGLNVWTEENGDVLFYLSRSGCFDENNTLLKLGRFRIHLTNPLKMRSFRQQLVLKDGYCQVTDGQRWIVIWVDVEKPVVHVEVSVEKEKTGVEVTYESWRTTDRLMTKREGFQSSYKFRMPQGTTTRRDSIRCSDDALLFVHHNGEVTQMDATVAQQQLTAVADQLYNPLRRLTFGGKLSGNDLRFDRQVKGSYMNTPYEGWTYASRKEAQRHQIQITMATLQGTIDDWLQQVEQTARQVDSRRDRRQTQQWWQQFWQRSYIESPLTIARNYTLFRYMLGCNAKSEWPTKFNGGLFTFDPSLVNDAAEYQLTPDFRNWGGGVHTAQNQRLVYWPMLKSGDTDLMKPQLDFYLRILQNATLRSEVYWHHGGACFTEQIENYGLPNYAEYGGKRPAGFDPGMERNAWLEYEWDTCLEFCMMALEAHRYSGMDITAYEPLIKACLQFFDEHYQYLATMRGAKRLDGNGKLVLYPGSGGETYKMAYNATSTVAALQTVSAAFLDYAQEQNDTTLTAYLSSLTSRLPELTIREGRILPALHYERVQNAETTQLYPVFPWRMYGVGRPDLDIARNTYTQDTLALKFRSHIGWKQDNIWAACLGMKDEAMRLAQLKLADGPYRFPAFWGPGYDWSPDHNWGGSGMIGLQEMLLQEVDDTLYLFPAWPQEQDVRFRLHASHGTVVEAELKGGKVVHLKTTPQRQVVCMYPQR